MKSILYLSLIVLTTLVSSVHAGPYSGTGEPNNPFRIVTAENMNDIGNNPNDWDKNFVLMNDIDLIDYTFTTAIIAPDINSSYGFQGIPFTGTFDGNGFVIINLTIEPNETFHEYFGLFGYNGGNIIHIGVKDFNINGIENSNYIGGIAGFNVGIISRSYSSGMIYGDDCLGGLVGENHGSISNCYHIGEINGINLNVGVPGNVSANIGGLIGNNINGNITNCYSVGNVNGGFDTGGLIGRNDNSVSNSFWDTDVSGLLVSNGGFGRSTSQMQTSSTYIGWGNGIWSIAPNNYPHLSWENKGGATIDNIPIRIYSGIGSQEDPFIIEDSNDLICMTARQEDWNSHFELGSNIDMNEISYYLPPGNFDGKIDGSNYTISNLSINEHGGTLLGLIGYLDQDGELINIYLDNVNVDGHVSLGGLVGHSNGGSVLSCFSSGSIGGSLGVGGLVGNNSGESNISNCGVNSIVNGDTQTGGLVGNNQGVIIDCHSEGMVYGNGSNAIGGLVGRNNGSVSICYSTSDVNCDSGGWIGGLVGMNCNLISNCYSTGSVIGGDSVGGLVGLNLGSVSKCYATGEVSGNNKVGGLLGYSGSTAPGPPGGEPSIDFILPTDSFWDIESSGLTIGHGKLNPEDIDPLALSGKTTYEMKQITTFANWDFIETWGIEDNQTYPFLKLTYPIGDLNYDHIVNMLDFAIQADHWLEETNRH